MTYQGSIVVVFAMRTVCCSVPQEHVILKKVDEYMQYRKFTLGMNTRLYPRNEIARQR